MHDFKFRNNELYCESVKVSSIAKKVKTPFYLYSHKTLVDHLTKIQKAFRPVRPLICFSMKSNGNLAVIKSLINEGAGIDVVSCGELKKAMRAGADPKTIVFASVGKTEEEISFALRKNILLFNVESLPELVEINRIAKKLDKRPQVALRINPDVDVPTHRYITTGTLRHKFGIDLSTARTILRTQKKYPNLKINGLHIHIGSQITSGGPFIKAITKVISFVDKLRKEDISLSYLDIGGGLGIIYRDENPQTAEDYAKAILPLLQKTKLKIILEPGRFIAGNAGIFVTRIVYLKDNGFKKFLIVDGGMNDLIRPALYHAYHNIVPVKKKAGKKITVDVVGPICESSDFLGKDRLLPIMKKNELLAVMSAGAYGFVMASNYNVRSRVPEILVKGNTFAVIRKRETFDDMLKDESIPHFLK